MKTRFDVRISNGKEEWLTPPEIILRLGPFDLDPCAPLNRPFETAYLHFTIENDGLAQPWNGRVWLNPPYSEHKKWIRKLSVHGNGIALLFARTDTSSFHDFIFPTATGILFLRGRIKFHHVSGQQTKLNSGAPSCLVAWGEENYKSLASSNLTGYLTRINHSAPKKTRLHAE
jgi:hypothetical protein